MTQSFVKQSILALLVLTLEGSYQSAKATTVKIYCPNPDAMNIVNHVGAGWTYTGDFEYHDVTKGPDISTGPGYFPSCQFFWCGGKI